MLALSAFLVWRLRADLVRGLDSRLDVRAQQTTLALEDPEDTHVTLDLEEFGWPCRCRADGA